MDPAHDVIECDVHLRVLCAAPEEGGAHGHQRHHRPVGHHGAARVALGSRQRHEGGMHYNLFVLSFSVRVYIFNMVFS